MFYDFKNICLHHQHKIGVIVKSIKIIKVLVDNVVWKF